MESRNIIGRDCEMAELQRCLDSDRSELVIVYGRRRVGKTFYSSMKRMTLLLSVATSYHSASSSVILPRP